MLARIVSASTARITSPYVNGSVVRVSNSNPRMSGPAAIDAAVALQNLVGDPRQGAADAIGVHYNGHTDTPGKNW